MYPKCFESAKEYKKWLGLFRAEEKLFKRPLHCLYCTPTYQREMLRVGHCDHPNIDFVVSEEDGIEGKEYKVKPWEKNDGVKMQDERNLYWAVCTECGAHFLAEREGESVCPCCMGGERSATKRV